MFGRTHVLPVALEFLTEYPEIDLRLLLNDRQVNMAEEHVDVAVRIGHLVDSGLRATRVGSVRPIAWASPAYSPGAARRRRPTTSRRMTASRSTASPAHPSGATAVTDRAWSAEPRTRLAVNSTEAAIAAVTAGLGIARLLSYQIADGIRSGALVAVLEDFAPEPMPVSLVYPEAGLLPHKVRAFLDWTGPRLRERLH
jgi:DNA-binding transcriptional LysR family regulator